MLLVTIATGHRLAPNPAASYARMCEAYGGLIPVTSAYRDSAAQAHLRREYLAGRGAFALPAGRSKHEIGEAADFAAGARLWLSLHAEEHGWVRTNPDEWWHREYFPGSDRHLPRPTLTPPTATPLPAPPAPDPFTEDTMDRLIVALYGHLLGRIPTAAEVDAWLVSAATEGTTSAQLAARFPNGPAEKATVIKAFRDYLGRVPADAEIDSWLADRRTIAAVCAGVAGSREALARR